jgi:thiol-disulfide isomerase/thioredoxin
MKIRTLLLVGLLIPSLYVSPASAQESAIDILHRTAATYQSLQSYEFKVTIQTIQGSNVSERDLNEAGVRPGKFRVEASDPLGELRIGDAQTEWTLSRKSSKYTKTSLTSDTETPISEFEGIDQHVAGAEIAREEWYLADGKTVPVYVVRVLRDRWPKTAFSGAEFAMYRIDMKTFAVHKVSTYSENASQVVLYNILKWNQPVSDALFTFTPPESAKAASSVSALAVQSKAIVGTQAADFTLSDPAGHVVNLHDLQGKVVIVDFWASWCGPCRAEMPYLQQMHNELANKGLVVLGLNVGEDSGALNEFASEMSCTFTLLMGAEPDISSKYYVEALPTTYVVDRAGRIVYRGVGGQPPDKLRSAVEAALRSDR